MNKPEDVLPCGPTDFRINTAVCIIVQLECYSDYRYFQ